MRIEEVPVKLFMRETTGSKRILKTRPVCDVDEKAYIFKKGYKVYLEKEDIPVLVYNTYMCKGVASEFNVKKYLKAHSFNGEDIYFDPSVPLYAIYDSKINSEWANGVIFLVDKDKELLTKKTKRDQRKQDITNNFLNTNKLLDTFFMDNVKAICEKYDLDIVEYSKEKLVRFKSTAAIVDIIRKHFENTLFKELRALGLILPDMAGNLVPLDILDLAKCKIDLPPNKDNVE